MLYYPEGLFPQSHHTGIEIKDPTVTTTTNSDPQSHHTGIEIWRNESGHFRAGTLNRTILELKWIWIGKSLKSKDTLNRTILELKFGWACLTIQRNCSLNRTILELKCDSYQSPGSNTHPSIAPYWNWNNIIKQELEPAENPSIAPYWNWNPSSPGLHSRVQRPQSHHTGIEMQLMIWNLKKYPNPQSHHTGIEIRNKYTFK